MDKVYRVISEWKCGGVIMITVETPGGCSVIEKKEWDKLWRNGKKIKTE